MKYFGKIGFMETIEKRPGVWVEEITEHDYYGDVQRVSRQYTVDEGVNDNLSISNRLSIVSDAFASENFHKIRYAVWMGVKWKISDIVVEPPRLILTLGGEWNDNENAS